MSIALHVGPKSYEIGTAEFFASFFSTVFTRLEAGSWAAQYPVVMKALYAGAVPASQCAQAITELRAIRAAFNSLPPSALVWDHARPESKPPWGNNVGPHITSLGNYFVTSSGRELFAVFEEAFQQALRSGSGVAVQ